MPARTPAHARRSSPQRPAAPVAAQAGAVNTRLVESLTEAIQQGRLVPGQRLVEADLQQQHGAGRSSVREALQQLAARGLVTLEPNRGASVRRLTRQDVVSLFQIRERLEGLAASLAAQRVAQGQAADAELRALRALLHRLGALAEAGDAWQYSQSNRELHDALMLLSANHELVHLVRQLSLPIFQRQFHGFLQREALRTSQDQHVRIVGAVLAGQPRRADAAMRAHVRDGLRLVLGGPAESFGPHEPPSTTRPKETPP